MDIECYRRQNFDSRFRDVEFNNFVMNEYKWNYASACVLQEAAVTIWTFT
jgi:hypothetical protein